MLPCPSTPERYSGDPEGYKGFILACRLYLCDCADMTDRQKISFVIQHLASPAMDWAAARWGTGAVITTTYKQFIHGVFDHLDNGRSGEQRLMRLRQGHRPVAEYTINFQVLAKESGWCVKALLARFRDGFQTEIQLELACKDVGTSLNDCITLAIKLD